MLHTNICNDFTDSEKINAVLSWADDDSTSHFKTEFVESLSEAHDKYGQLTDRQSESLDNIIKRFKIDLNQYS